MATTLEAWEHHEPELIAVVEAASLNGEVSEAVDNGATSLVVDLRAAESVGTHGLNTLLDARCRIMARGGEIAVVLPPKLRRFFGLLNLDRRFVLAANRRQAFELLGLVDSHPLSPRPSEHHRARAA
jgi:anti-anti-sigma regulatory factor